MQRAVPAAFFSCNLIRDVRVTQITSLSFSCILIRDVGDPNHFTVLQLHPDQGCWWPKGSVTSVQARWWPKSLFTDTLWSSRGKLQRNQKQTLLFDELRVEATFASKSRSADRQAAPCPGVAHSQCPLGAHERTAPASTWRSHTSACLWTPHTCNTHPTQL